MTTMIRRVIAASKNVPEWTLFLAFLLPIGVGLIQRFSRPNHWFRDYDAVSCAASRIAQHSELYVHTTHCILRKPTPYVYPPYLASLWSALQHSTGISGATALYGGLYYFLLIYILRILITGRSVGGQGWLRACLLTVIGADIFICGNIAVIVHCTLALCAVLFWEIPIVLVAGIICAAAIKPIFLVYNAVFLLHPMRWRQKIFYTGLATAGGILPFVAFMKLSPHLFKHDMALIRYYALINDRGAGFLNLMSLIGLRQFSADMATLYVIGVAILLSSAIYICRVAQARANQRIWIGITVSILSDPRLMFYDVLTLAPGIVSLVGLSARLGRSAERVGGGLVVALCIACAVLNSRGGQYGLYVFVPAAYVLIIALAGGFLVESWRSREQSIKGIPG